MVTFYEMIPEIIPLFFVVLAIVVARCFTEPLAETSEVIDKSEFKSLQQGLYNKKNTMQYDDDA
jgi:branched-subunit amino acid permease